MEERKRKLEEYIYIYIYFKKRKETNQFLMKVFKRMRFFVVSSEKASLSFLLVLAEFYIGWLKLTFIKTIPHSKSHYIFIYMTA